MISEDAKALMNYLKALINEEPLAVELPEIFVGDEDFKELFENILNLFPSRKDHRKYRCFSLSRRQFGSNHYLPGRSGFVWRQASWQKSGTVDLISRLSECVLSQPGLIFTLIFLKNFLTRLIGNKGYLKLQLFTLKKAANLSMFLNEHHHDAFLPTVAR